MIAILTRTTPCPQAGIVDDIEREDDRRGYERDETDNHHLGAELLRRARTADTRIRAGQRARRTLQEMMPGYERQPVLTLYRPVMADDACPLCGWWRCRCADQASRRLREGREIA